MMLIGNQVQSSRKPVHSTAGGTANAAANTTGVSGMTVAQPEIRTPQNVGYLEAALTAAGLVCTTYLVIMYRRWSRLKLRRERNNSRNNAR